MRRANGLLGKYNFSVYFTCSNGVDVIIYFMKNKCRVLAIILIMKTLFNLPFKCHSFVYIIPLLKSVVWCLLYLGSIPTK